MAKRRRVVPSLIAMLLLLASTACGNSAPRPSSGPSAMIVALRWCVLEGSLEAGGTAAGSLVSTYRANDMNMLAQANEIWAPARLIFVSVVAERNGIQGVPVIKDNDHEPGSQAGDVSIDSADDYYPVLAAKECYRTWKSLAPSKQGPIVLTIRQFKNGGLTLGVTPGPKYELLAGKPGASRPNDLCGEPRHLTPQDVFELDSNALHGTYGWTMVPQFDQFRNAEHRAHAFAHELGHLMLLGHGNGLDDNQDGTPVGQSGPRRYDAYCDPLGTMAGSSGAIYPKEDLTATGETCQSIMHPNAGCLGLSPLQIEQARAVAAVMPGCQGGGCKL